MRIFFNIVASLVLISASGFLLVHAQDSDSQDGAHSVEIGLAEVSPLGSSGGFAVPASGEAPPTPAPRVSLFVRSQAGVWTGDNITIYAGDDLDLRWLSTDAVSCTGVAFTVPGSVPNGLQTTVTAPAVGASISYTVNCTNSVGSASDTLVVTAIAGNRPQCSDDVDNSDPEDTLIDWDGGSTPVGATSCWVKGTGSCSAVCATAAGTSVGGQCTSGEDRSAESIDQLLAAGAYIYGCWWDGSCRSGFAGAGTEFFESTINKYACYVPNQKHDGNKDKTDWIVGCNCNVPDSSLCTTPPAPVYGTPDPGCTGPTDDDETDGAPTVTLSVRNGDSSWTGNNISIVAGDNINLRWESSNATQCTATAFSIGATTNVNGTQTTVTEPVAGASTLYSITCTGTSGPDATDSLTVTTLAAGRPPTIDASPLIVRSGEESTINWDVGTADPAECSTSGQGLKVPLLTSPSGTKKISVTAETIYTIVCPLGSDTVTVKVLPTIQET